MPTVQNDIYTRLLEAAPLFTPPPPWDFVPACPDCRLCPTFSPGLLDTLVAEFGRETLLRRGVAVSTASGGLSFNPMLHSAGSPLLILRDAQGIPFDVVTEAGCLSGQWPLLQIWKDHATIQAAGYRWYNLFRYMVLGVSSMAEVVLFRCLGVPAVPVTGFDRLGFDGLQFLAALAGERPFFEEEVRLPPEYYDPREPSICCDDIALLRRFCLTLCPRSFLAEATGNSAAIVRAARHLAGAGRELGIDWSGIQVWQPGAAELNSLDFRRRLRDRDLLRYFLLEPTRVCDLDEFVRRTAPPADMAAEFIASQDALLKTLAGNGRKASDSARRHAQRQHDRSMERVLVEPLIRQALAAPDPVERSKLLALADLSRRAHRQSLQELAAQAHAADLRPGGASMKEYLGTVNSLVALTKQIQQ